MEKTSRRRFLRTVVIGGLASLAGSSCAPLRKGFKGGPGFEGNVEHYEQGLVMELPLLDNTEDISGHNADGINHNVRFVNDPTFKSVASFNGAGSFVEVPSRPEFSYPHNGGLTVSFWVNPSTLNFSHAEGTGPYVNYLGKGNKQQNEEWAFRIYNKSTYRPNRMSFYMFNPNGGLGVGSYVEEGLKLGNWMFITGVIDSRYTHMYKNGVLRDSDDWHHSSVGGSYIGMSPVAGHAPIRIGTYNGSSWFAGKIVDVRIYNRALSPTQVNHLFNSYYQ